MLSIRRLATLSLLLLATAAVGGAEVPSAPWFPQAPPLPQPTGQIIRVSNVEALFHAANEVQPGGTILLADGIYRMPRYFELRTDDVTLRSESGERDRVILDGTNSRHGELIGISECRGVTIADLTIQNIKWNGFKINSNRHATEVTIRNCVIHNVWQRGVKGPAVDTQDRGRFWPTDCRIQYCLFYNDRPKTYADDPADTPKNFRGNYIGGIDAMHARQWKITDNVFLNINGRTGEGRAAIFLWNESQDCVVDGNVIVDCDVGISLGNPSRNSDTRWHDNGCIVRNNLITRCSETGILAAWTRNCLILHNTIHDPESRLKRLIWIQQDNDGLVVANNLLSGPPLRDTGASRITALGNFTEPNLAEQFVDAAAGNVRLTGKTTPATQRFPAARQDIDGRARPRQPQPGAHEFGAEPAEMPISSPAATSEPDDDLGESAAWVESMRRVHAGFDGTSGYVAQLGDSITYSMAFWSPLGWSPPEEYLTGDDELPRKPKNQRWRDALAGVRDKGPKFANYSGWRVGQLVKNVDQVLQREKPEMAVIMIGTNDISGKQVPSGYSRQLARVIDKCLSSHCIPLLTTIPPRRDHEDSVSKVNRIIRRLAEEKNLPLIDFHAEILKRRPGKSWDGTLISDDGVHPTSGENHVYTPENLRNSGYALRNWVTFRMVREVYFRVLHPVADDSRREERSEAGRSDAPGASRDSTRNMQSGFEPRDGASDESAAGAASRMLSAPRVLSSHVADAYSLQTFAQFPRWRDLTGDEQAFEVYRYLADQQTGLFHMNVVAEGEDSLSEFVQIRDPVKIINVYGYAYCGIYGPTMAGVCEGIGLGPARTVVLPLWNHVASEVFYEDDWHYLDLDVRAIFRRSTGELASLSEARKDAALWRDRGPLFFPNDDLDATQEIYAKTAVQTYYGFQQTGHTMDYVLRPGERFIRWWNPQGGRWHHLRQYNDKRWLRELLESSPRGPKPNHRHFSVHNHGNGLFLYQPKLSNKFQDFEQGVHDCTNVTSTSSGLRLATSGRGEAVFEVRSPYIIVPQVGELENTEDDRNASLVEVSGDHVDVEISADNGLTWHETDEQATQFEDGREVIDLTPWVSGRYGFLLKFVLTGEGQEAILEQFRIATWVQVAPASLPKLEQGLNELRFVTGDHYRRQTRVKEVRSRAGTPRELLKYLVAPPEDYDPQRKTGRIKGEAIVKVEAPPGTKIAWFTATGQFATYQRQAADRTDNRMAYAVGVPSNFQTIYKSDIPSYTDHWHYNAAREIVLDEPAQKLFVRYTGSPAVNNFAIYAHCEEDRPTKPVPTRITHQWSESDKLQQAQVTLEEPGQYEVMVEGMPENRSIQLEVPHLLR